jgi:hypothetical protein
MDKYPAIGNPGTPISEKKNPESGKLSRGNNGVPSNP